MSRHRKVIDAELARQVSAIRRIERLSRSLSWLQIQAGRELVKLLPDNPNWTHIHVLDRSYQAIQQRLLHLMQRRAYQDLFQLAEWSHLRVARSLTALARRELREDAADYLRLIIPAPIRSLLEAIVMPVLNRLAGIVSSNPTWSLILQGISEGKNRTELARDIRDSYHTTAVSARRTVRTQGLLVATQSQLQASETIAEEIIGYQVLSVLDSRVRPEHRARHGTIYYRTPRGSQPSMAQMPQPPIDPGNKIAWNCRCILVPVFSLREANSVDVQAMLGDLV